MNRNVLFACALMVGVGGGLMASCSKPQQAKAPATEKFRDAPDFGGVTKQYAEADGVGKSRAAAIDDALKLAIKQVNGVAIDDSSAQLNLAASFTTDDGGAHVAASEFAQAITSQSKGRISDFKIVSEQAPKSTDGDWRVRIGANIAKYRAAPDANRPKVVVAAAHGADGGPAADQLSHALQARLSDAISQTNRFTVLDRQADQEVQSELDLISSGNGKADDEARLGQQLSADLIVIPTVEHMAYDRHARHLEFANRDLVSYSGGARISFKVINAVTRQIVLEDAVSEDFPTTAPSLGASVNVSGTESAALTRITDRFVAELLRKTFPISVISLNGTDVVLSQGGAAVQAGATYRAVMLGEELKDPQTGQSLGRSEHDIGTITITRSDPNTSVGQLQTGANIGGEFKPGMIELRDQVQGASAPSRPLETAAVVPPKPPAHRAKGGKAKAVTASPSKPDDDKSW